MSRSTDRNEHHLSDETLVFLAEGADPGDGVRDHLEACETCRTRLDATCNVLRAVAGDPPMPDEATFAARRARIREAIDERRHPAAQVHPVRAHARWWVPLAAAAVVATILVTRPSPESEGPGAVTRTATNEPAAAQSSFAEEPELPVLAEADRAIAEATRELEPIEATGSDDPAGAGIEPPQWIDNEAIDLALEDLETTDPVLTAASDEDDRLLLEERFAALSSDEQEVILNELSTMPLEL